MQALIADLNNLCKEIDSKQRYMAMVRKDNWESEQGVEEVLNEIKKKLEQIIVKHFVYNPLFAQMDKSVLERSIRSAIRNSLRRNGTCVERQNVTVTKDESSPT